MVVDFVKLVHISILLPASVLLVSGHSNNLEFWAARSL